MYVITASVHSMATSDEEDVWNTSNGFRPIFTPGKYLPNNYDPTKPFKWAEIEVLMNSWNSTSNGSGHIYDIGPHDCVKGEEGLSGCLGRTFGDVTTSDGRNTIDFVYWESKLNAGYPFPLLGAVQKSPDTHVSSMDKKSMESPWKVQESPPGKSTRKVQTPMFH